MAESEMALRISDVASETNASEVEYVVRCRGLPYSASPEELRKFFSGCNISDIYLTQTFDARPTGEAFIEFDDEDSYNSALSKNKEHMGKRYIEVFESDKREMDYQVKKSKPGSDSSEGVIRMRGLPFNCNKSDIKEFFSDFQLKEDGVVLVQQSDGRASGEGFVQLASPHKVDDALKLNNGHIGHRYVELFPSTYEEMSRHSEGNSGGRGSGYISPKTFRPSPYDRPGSGSSRGMRGARRDGRSRGSFGRGGRSTYRQDYRDYEQPEYSYEYDYDEDYEYDNCGFEMGRGHGGGGGGGMVAYPMKGHASESQDYIVRMRGLPFSASDDDIYTFFYPYVPSSINIRYDSSGRASGEAEVGFSTLGDAKSVMSKDRQNMGRRYIELFLDSDEQEGHASFRSRGGSAPRTGAYGRSSMMTGAYSLPPPGTRS